MKTRNCLCGMFLFGAIMLSFSCKPEEEPMYGRAGDLLEEGKVWSSLHLMEVMPGRERLAETKLYWIEGDTVIEGRVWKKHYYAATDNCSERRFNHFLRQEGEKLYAAAYSWKGFSEGLLFDFGKKEGDTMRVVAVGGELGVAVVRVYDTVLPGGDGRLLRAMDVVALEGGDVGQWAGVLQVKDTWVEGIGSLTDGLNFVFRMYGLAGWQTMDFVLCCGKGDELLYQNSAFGTCRIDDFEDIPDGALPD